MIRTCIFISIAFLLAAVVLGCKNTAHKPDKTNNTVNVIFETNLGNITIECYADKAPVSVENFLSYINKGFYTNTLFHRVIKDFMIQAGGFDVNMNKKDTDSPIVNEAANGLKNKRGTIAYARTNVINSATSQFFINHVDNNFLNYRDSSPGGFGYAVFGKVTEGMDVVDKIASVETGVKNGMNDVPVKPVIILSAKIIKRPE
jgi:cyclophilin family peptidyl-prolyl cis-trans isomerase